MYTGILRLTMNLNFKTPYGQSFQVHRLELKSFSSNASEDLRRLKYPRMYLGVYLNTLTWSQ